MTVRKKNSILIIDTNIFLTGIDFNLFEGEIYTTNKIFDEINVSRYRDKNRTILSRFQAALDNGKLHLKTPSEEYIKKVEDISETTGDKKALSDADKEIIALSLEFSLDGQNEVILYTNDYSMQNLCKALGIKFKPLFREGIKRGLKFEIYCPICKIVYDSDFLNRECEKCGLKLKRRPIADN